MQNAHRSFWNKPRAAPRPSAAAEQFARLASGAAFQTRYIGEQTWWPIAHSEIAQSLEDYHVDLESCLTKLLGGEILQSPLAEFRLAVEATRPSVAQSATAA